MLLKHELKRLIPPFMLDMCRPRPLYGWFGDYPAWADACRQCSGYDAANILEKCKSALLKVKNGEAVHERDSVLFDKVEYSWPVLAGLLRCALESDGKLHVLDFGGSLGSSYYQNRMFLSGLKEFSWSIVEQPHFVACGREAFEDGTLKFYQTIEDVLLKQMPDLLLLSSVLQYLEDPYRWLKRFSGLGMKYIIIDRTAFIEQSRDVIMIQKVPPHIYEAGYPCWAFNEARFLEAMTAQYQVMSDFSALDRSNYQGMYFKGFILKLRS